MAAPAVQGAGERRRASVCVETWLRLPTMTTGDSTSIVVSPSPLVLLATLSGG